MTALLAAGRRRLRSCVAPPALPWHSSPLVLFFHFLFRSLFHLHSIVSLCICVATSAGRARCASTSATWACPARSPRLEVGQHAGALLWLHGERWPSTRPADNLRSERAAPNAVFIRQSVAVAEIDVHRCVDRRAQWLPCPASSPVLTRCPTPCPAPCPILHRSTRTSSSRRRCCPASASWATTQSRSWPSRQALCMLPASRCAL